jgi:hypothetical protein
MIDHREIKFEEAIEQSLNHHGGYSQADPKNFDRAFAIDPGTLLAFSANPSPPNGRSSPATTARTPKP